MIVLGIDPGYGRMGYGILEVRGADSLYIAHGCIETSAKKPLPDRLAEIHHALLDLIRTYHPSRSGVEEVFFAKNTKTAFGVGAARGVILLTLKEADIPIDEWTPLEVKQAVTGYGRATKTQLQKMIALRLHLPKRPLQDDAADALAVAFRTALCVNHGMLQKK